MDFGNILQVPINPVLEPVVAGLQNYEFQVFQNLKRCNFLVVVVLHQ